MRVSKLIIQKNESAQIKYLVNESEQMKYSVNESEQIKYLVNESEQISGGTVGQWRGSVGLIRYT